MFQFKKVIDSRCCKERCREESKDQRTEARQSS